MKETPSDREQSEKAICLNCHYEGRWADFSGGKGSKVCPACGASAIKPAP